MNRLNADGHDESQYLPKKWFNPKTQKEEPYPFINAYRKNKGDIFLNKDDQMQTLSWLPDALELKGFIEKEHHDTCKSFERILIQAKRTLGICDIRGVLFEKLPEEIRNELDMFIVLKKELLKSYMVTMIWLVEAEVTNANISVVGGLVGKVHHAIENTQRIIDNSKNTA